MAIIADIEAGLSNEEQFEICPDREEAIRLAATRAQAGDVVLIAGKGAEKYIEREGNKIPYNDLEVIESL